MSKAKPTPTPDNGEPATTDEMLQTLCERQSETIATLRADLESANQDRNAARRDHATAIGEQNAMREMTTQAQRESAALVSRITKERDAIIAALRELFTVCTTRFKVGRTVEEVQKHNDTVDKIRELLTIIDQQQNK